MQFTVPLCLKITWKVSYYKMCQMACKWEFLKNFKHSASDEAKWSQFHVLHDIAWMNWIEHSITFLKHSWHFYVQFIMFLMLISKQLRCHARKDYYLSVLFLHVKCAQQFKVKKEKYRHHRLILSCLPCLSLFFLSKIYLEKSFEIQLLNQHLHRKPLLAAICHFSINVV